MLFFGLHELSVNFNSRKLSLSFDHDLTVTIVTHSHRLSRAISRQSPVLVKGNQWLLSEHKGNSPTIFLLKRCHKIVRQGTRPQMTLVT